MCLLYICSIFLPNIVEWSHLIICAILLTDSTENLKIRTEIIRLPVTIPHTVWKRQWVIHWINFPVKNDSFNVLNNKRIKTAIVHQYKKIFLWNIFSCGIPSIWYVNCQTVPVTKLQLIFSKAFEWICSKSLIIFSTFKSKIFQRCDFSSISQVLD